MSLHYIETQYGFEYGPVKVSRLFSDNKKGWVTISVETTKYPIHGIQIYVTKTGKVRISDPRGEWTPPKPASSKIGR